MSGNRKNSAKGRNSFDAEIGDTVVGFLNRNSTPYPVDVGGPSFEPVPVKQHKDIMINVARMHAEQEYNRIMDLVTVLQSQAADIKRRLDITDMVHDAHYNFKPVHGQIYWLAEDTRKNQIILIQLGPNDWHAGAPSNLSYQYRVKWLGDHTWCEVNDEE